MYHYAIRKLLLLGCTCFCASAAADIEWLDSLSIAAGTDSVTAVDTTAAFSNKDSITDDSAVLSVDNDVLYPAEKDIDRNVVSKVTAGDSDRKSRMHIVMQHSEWPRRIRNVVRDGRICLDMNTDQLLASWGVPMQRDSIFISDKVKYQVWIFKGKTGTLISVNVIHGKVKGWSL